MAVDVRPLVDMEQGILSPRVYCDEDIFQLELERLFGRCWPADRSSHHQGQLQPAGDVCVARLRR